MALVICGGGTREAPSLAARQPGAARRHGDTAGPQLFAVRAAKAAAARTVAKLTVAVMQVT